MSRGRWTRKLPIVERQVTIEAPARFGVLSDTHTLAAGRQRSLEPVFDFFRRAQVTMILHAGDAGSLTLLGALEAIAPIAAVRGNADPPELIEALPDRVMIMVDGRSVLLMHGHHGRTARAAASAAAAVGIDLIVFGHSHQPLIEQHGETILFNPGSPTDRRWNPHFGIGLIDVSHAAIEPELILFDNLIHLANVAP